MCIRDSHGPGGQRLKPGDRAQEAGLPAAARPEDRGDAALRNLQAHALDRERGTEADRDVADREHQNAPTDETRNRSTRPMTVTVTTARMTEAASAMPRLSLIHI